MAILSPRAQLAAERDRRRPARGRLPGRAARVRPPLTTGGSSTSSWPRRAIGASQRRFAGLPTNGGCCAARRPASTA